MFPQLAREEQTAQGGTLQYTESAMQEAANVELDDVSLASRATLSAVHYGFSAAERIYVGDRLTGNVIGKNAAGVPNQSVPRAWIEPCRFAPFRNTAQRVPLPNNTPDGVAAAMGGADRQGYMAVEKLAGHIAQELYGAYHERGYITVNALTGIDEALAGEVQRALFARVPTVTDPQLPGERVVVLPELIRQLRTETAAHISTLPTELGALAEAVRVEVLRSAETEMAWERAALDIKKVSIDIKRNGGQGPDFYDKRDFRAFLKLGLRIPGDASFYTEQLLAQAKSAAPAAATPAPAFDSSVLDLLVEQRAEALRREEMQREEMRVLREQVAELSAKAGGATGARRKDETKQAA